MSIDLRPLEDHPHCREGKCERCNTTVGTAGGADIYCDCGAIYNCFGQRLRDDLNTRPNPSDYDDDIDDLTGYEIAMGRNEE